MSESKILKDLNEEQKRAITAPPGPVLVLAGPGSGKTRVLTHRIAWYVHERDIPPQNIVALTFTNKAAREMRERAEALLQGSLIGARMRTFHSLCAGLLRRESADTHFGADYLIYDQQDRHTAIKQALYAEELDHHRYPPRQFLRAISSAKNQLIEANQFSGEDYFGELVARVYRRYAELLARNNARDFDDLLLHTFQLLKTNAEIREKYQHIHAHLLVDEFQDTNYAQYHILRLLAPTSNSSLFIVGDPNQAIYGFRGADYQNLARFRADYPAVQEIVLFRNYRSPQYVLDLASALINHNPQRQPVRLIAAASHSKPIGDGQKPPRATLIRVDDDRTEAQFVCAVLREHLSREGNLRDCAVMYRTNKQSRALETELTRQKILYQLIGGISFYRRIEVRDILAYLRFLENPRDSVSFERIINTPRRGIGEKTLAKLHQWSTKAGLNYGQALDVLRENAVVDDWDSEVRNESVALLADLNINNMIRSKLFHFAELLESWRDLAQSAPVARLLRQVMDDIQYWDYLAKISDSEEQRQKRVENVEELESYLSENSELTLTEFLAEATMVADVDEHGPERDLVTLQTLHTAKGLEYPLVFIVGLEDGILPHRLSLDEKNGVQEERRLFYVGITRCMNHLFLSHSQYRNLPQGANLRQPSRFLRELSPALLQDERGRSLQSLPAKLISQLQDSIKGKTLELPAVTPKRKRNGDSNSGLAAEKAEGESNEFAVGMRVSHPRFGPGEILAIQELGPDDHVLTVAFANQEFGQKRLVASRVKLKRI